jgi:hypothetical protein
MDCVSLTSLAKLTRVTRRYTSLGTQCRSGTRLRMPRAPICQETVLLPTLLPTLTGVICAVTARSVNRAGTCMARPARAASAAWCGARRRQACKHDYSTLRQMGTPAAEPR